MGGVCSKKPAVKHDVDDPADDNAPNLPHISPLPAVPEGKTAATGASAQGPRVSNGDRAVSNGDADHHDHPSSVRLSFESTNGDGRVSARDSTGRLSEDDPSRPRTSASSRLAPSPSRPKRSSKYLAQDDDHLIARRPEGVPWYFVEDPMRWTGPPIPTAGPSEEEEPFMISTLKTNIDGFQALPWEGVERTAPAVIAVIDHALTHLRVDPAAGRLDTIKADVSPEEIMSLMRRASADVMMTPVFSFMLKVFEGPDTDPAIACHRFFKRILTGCKNAVFCTVKHPAPKAYEEITDGKHAGAALYLRVFLVRFVKRFPPQHQFVHPHVDAPETRRQLCADLGDSFQSWCFMRATEHHPAAIVVRKTNKGIKSCCRVPQPIGWTAVNHFYEFCVSQPSRQLCGLKPVFIIDLAKPSMTYYTQSNITKIAHVMQAAMFHPEPFSAFVVAHSPSVFQFIWSIAKYFLTESAREKFVILSGSASKHFHNKMGIGLEHIPKEVGGKSETEGLITVAELLSEIHQQPAVDAFRRDAKVAEASVSDATTPETGTTAAAANTVVPQAERVRLRSLRKELYMAFEGNVEGGPDDVVTGSEEVVTGPETVVKGPEDVREVEKVEKAPSGSAGSAAGAGSVALAAKPPSALPKQLVVAAVVALIAMVLGLIYELIAGR